MTVLPDVIVFNASQMENPAYKDEDSYAETICNILFDAVGLWCSGFHCDEDTIPGKIIVSAINWGTPPMDSEYLRVQDLSREQMIELKQNYYCKQHDDASYGELAAIDLLISDEEIIEVYGSTDFSPDDFFCSAGDTNLFVVRFIRTDDGAHEEYYYTKYKDAIFHFGLFLNDDSDLYREIQLVNLCESVI